MAAAKLSSARALPAVQRVPPTSITGLSAAASIAAIRAAPASGTAGSGMVTGSQGNLSEVPTSMSSGSATTTGPGLPLIATVQARLMISGTRST